MAKKLYRVRFINESKVYEVYARQVYQDNLYGFVAVEGLVFGETGRVVVDPSEERLKSEFEGVSLSYIPMQAVLRIDQVEKQGAAKIQDYEGKVTPFPVPPHTSKDTTPGGGGR